MKPRIFLISSLICICLSSAAQNKVGALRIDGGCTLTNGDINLPAIMFGAGSEYYFSLKSSFGLMLTMDGYSSEKSASGNMVDENWHKKYSASVRQVSIEPFYSYRFRKDKEAPHFYVTLGSGIFKATANATLSEGEYQFLGEFSNGGEIVGSRWTKKPSSTVATESYAEPWKFKWSLQLGYDLPVSGYRTVVGFYIKYNSFEEMQPFRTISSRPIGNDFHFSKSDYVLPVKICVTFKFTGKDKLTRQREKRESKFLEEFKGYL